MDKSTEGQNLFLFPVPAAKPKAKPKPKKSEVDPKRFELAYQYYPRKIGKAKGIKLAQANILTEDEFTAFGKALVIEYPSVYVVNPFRGVWERDDSVISAATRVSGWMHPHPLPPGPRARAHRNR